MPAAIAQSWSLTNTLATLAAAATICGLGATAWAIWYAARQLQVQAQSQKLTAVLETNRLWNDVQVAVSVKVPLSGALLDLVRLIFEKVLIGYVSGLDGSMTPSLATQSGTPYLLACFFPEDASLEGQAPESERAYFERVAERTLAVGVTLTLLHLLTTPDVDAVDIP